MKTSQKTAIALKYDETRAPTVTAKGTEEIAEEILRIARESDVPLYENPELVAALSHIDLGEEIPEALYRIVAEVIAFAFYLRGKVPDNFQPDTPDTSE